MAFHARLFRNASRGEWRRVLAKRNEGMTDGISVGPHRPHINSSQVVVRNYMGRGELGELGVLYGSPAYLRDHPKVTRARLILRYCKS